MKTVKIPDTDLILSGIGLGTAQAGIRWSGESGDRLLETYLEAGGNIIDTAHVYSDWVPGEIARSERVLGDWIRRRGRRDDFILMTKGAHPRFESMTTGRLSKEEVTSDLDSSLEKLGVDYVDVYFYHRDDESRTVEELIETMEDFRRAGKIRYYACSNWSTARMKEADAYCEKKGYRGFVANQAMYNIGVKYMGTYPDATMVICDQEMLDYHKNSKNLLIPYMGICGGFFHALAKKGQEAMKDNCFCTEGNLRVAEDLSKLCSEKGWSMTQALLGFIATREFAMVPLAAASNEKQMADLTATLQTEFSAKDFEMFQEL
ncbi:MAG: aldo/keto reductase [Lachnospiraceae bacterium]|nr:aldo/keto reductase [Lachnospiraceae bacterium]